MHASGRFFYRATLCIARLCYGKSSIRPSVCLSVTLVHAAWSYSLNFLKFITHKLACREAKKHRSSPRESSRNFSWNRDWSRYHAVSVRQHGFLVMPPVQYMMLEGIVVRVIVCLSVCFSQCGFSISWCVWCNRHVRVWFKKFKSRVNLTVQSCTTELWLASLRRW